MVGIKEETARVEDGRVLSLMVGGWSLAGGSCSGVVLLGSGAGASVIWQAREPERRWRRKGTTRGHCPC